MKQKMNERKKCQPRVLCTTHQTKHHENDGENDNNDENEQNMVFIQKIILEL